MDLTRTLIESYNMPKERVIRSREDFGFDYTLPCGVVVRGTYVSYYEPCEMDILYGLDDWLEIKSKEELEFYMSFKDAEKLLLHLKDNDEEFPYDEMKEEYL